MAGLQGMKVTAYIRSGSGDDEEWSYVTSTTTATDGTYALAGLNVGTYRLKFHDPDGDYLTEYYNNKSSLDKGNNIAVAATVTVSNVNAVLGQASYITGTVSDS